MRRMRRELLPQKLLGLGMVAIGLLVAALNGGETSILPILIGVGVIATKEKCIY